MTDQKRTALEMMERCHVRLSERSAQLCTAAAALAEQRDLGSAAAVVKEVVAFLKRTGRRHINDEERSIFPLLPDDLAHLVEQLTNEHREQEKLLRDMDKLTALWPARPPTAAEGTNLQRLAKQLADNYREHAALEDKQLLPALKALSEEARQTIVEEMQARRDARGRARGQRGRGGRHDVGARAGTRGGGGGGRGGRGGGYGGRRSGGGGDR